MDNIRDQNDYKPQGVSGYLCVVPVSVYVCRFAAYYKSVNCNCGTDVGSQPLTVFGVSQ